jgi:ribonuclease HI
LASSAGTGVYRWGSRRGYSFSLALHITAFQAEIHAIKANIREKIENGYTGGNIYVITDSQAAIKALNSFHINSALVWHCYKSVVKLAEHNRIQLLWVAGLMGLMEVK